MCHNDNSSEICNASILRKINHNVAYMLTPVAILGIVGNIISVIVLMKIQRTNPGVRLLKVLSFVDAILLVVLLEHTLIGAYEDQQRMVVIIDGLRSVSIPMTQTVYTVEIYLTVLIGFQRAFALTKPLLKSVYMRDSVITACIWIIVVASVIFNIPNWLMYDRQLIWEPRLNMTWATWSLSDFQRTPGMRIYRRYITLIFRAVIPMIVLLVCSIVIVFSVKRRISNTNHRNNCGHLTKMNIAIITTSLITHLSNAMDDVIFRDNQVTFTVSISLLIIESSTNFIIYCVFGKLFQRTLMDLMKRMCKKCIKH